MTDRVARVRIDRLVLRGVDLELHDAASLSDRVAAAIEHPRPGPGHHPARGADAQAIAAAIADRVSAAVAGERNAR